jgi:PKD repeat protein
MLTARFTVTPPKPGPAPASVAVDGSGSTGGQEPILSYAWDFGDGTSTTGPAAEHTYQSNGSYIVTLTVTDQAGASHQSSRSVFIGEQPPQALFVAGGGSGDEAVTARLLSLGYEVITKSDGAVTIADASDVELVLISSTITSGTVGATFTDAPVPVIVWEPYLFDDMGMTGGGEGDDYGFDESAHAVDLVGANQALAAGLTPGLTATGPVVTYGVPGPGAAVVATLPGDQSRSTIFAYEEGSQMVSGTAPSRRLGFFFFDNTAASLSEDGWRLFDAGVEWATRNGMAVSSLPRAPARTVPADGAAMMTVVDNHLLVHPPEGARRGKLRLYAANGTAVRHHLIGPAANRFPLKGLARGVYLITVEHEGKKDRRTIVVR